MDHTIRAMAHQDGPALRLLLELSPDSGALSVVYRSLFDPYEVTLALHPDSVGVVAETPSGELVGMAFIQLGEGRFAGGKRPIGRPFGLVVHPDQRRKGLATTLYLKLLDQARKLQGPETLILAEIQERNEASLRAAKTWATQIVEARIRHLFARTTNRPPRPQPRLTVRAAGGTDWEAFAEATNRFHQNEELYPTATADSLRTFHARAPFGFPLQTALVAVDSQGALAAGLSVVFDGLVETGLYPSLPWGLKLVNGFLKFAPSGGVLKRLTVRDLWFQPGAEAAALHLWQSAAWLLRDKGNRLMISVDSRGLLADVLPKQAFLPEEGGVLALASDQPLDPNRPLFLA